jgi:hypothetical protein
VAGVHDPVGGSTVGTAASYEHTHGPPATHPEQQKARPRWNTAGPTGAISQVGQVNAGSVLGRVIGSDLGCAADVASRRGPDASEPTCTRPETLMNEP